MKKRREIWIAVLLAGSVLAEKDVQVKVTGNRVSLRAAPALNSSFMGRVKSGDLLTLKDSNSNGEWFGVAAPESVNVWVKGECVENDKVVSKTLDVHSGPSPDHKILGKLHQGDPIFVRGRSDGWLRIVPPRNTIVWVSRKYSEALGKLDDKPDSKIMYISSSKKSTTVKPEEKVVPPETKVSFVRERTFPASLISDPDKEQGVQQKMKGILKGTEQKLFVLVDAAKQDHVLCYVRGNVTQLNTYINRTLILTGKAFWAIDLDVPVIAPVKIQVLKTG